MALTIAGSDPSGGAGIQADLKTFHQFGVYGEAVITLLTVQNTRRVSRVEFVDAALVTEQLEAVIEDIPPTAAKTGALGNAAITEAIAAAARSFTFPLVVDPVMISKHGAALLDEPARVALKEMLLPRATLVTPNAHEAAWLSGRDVFDRASAADAARAIADLGAWAVLVKGGHLGDKEAVDLLFANGQLHELSAPRIDTVHTHGTGCTYSAAITARLAGGEPLLAAVSEAKGWLTETLLSPPKVGHGIGPVDHMTRVARQSRPPGPPRDPERG